MSYRKFTDIYARFGVAIVAGYPNQLNVWLIRNLWSASIVYEFLAIKWIHQLYLGCYRQMEERAMDVNICLTIFFFIFVSLALINLMLKHLLFFINLSIFLSMSSTPFHAVNLLFYAILWWVWWDNLIIYCSRYSGLTR